MIENFIKYLSESTNSQFVQGTIFAGLLTSLYGIIKIVLPWLVHRFTRLFVFRMTIEQTDELYVLVDKYIAEKYPQKLKNVEAFLKTKYEASNYVQLVENDDISDKISEVKIRQFKDYITIFYRNNFIKIQKDREKLDGSTSMFSSFMGSITITGLFAKNTILSFIREVNELEKKAQLDSKDKIIKYVWDTYSWRRTFIYQSKGFNNLFFDDKQELISKIDFFESNKDLFINSGAEWYLGVLLSGEPGTGKTSVAKAIAKHTNRDLYIMNLSSMSNDKFLIAFSEIGHNACVLFDDIDINVPDRDSNSKDKVSLQSILSVLDGAESRSDIIIVMTTNYIDKLDSALIRDGRIDYHFVMKKPNKNNVEEMLSSIYKKDINLPNNFKLSESIPKIQNICLYNDYEKAIKLIQQQQQ